MGNATRTCTVHDTIPGSIRPKFAPCYNLKFIRFISDKNPIKQGLYCPGSKIPIFSEKKIRDYKPDFIVIFPWNIKDEIKDQLEFTREWGCKLVVAIPKLSIF